MHQSFTEPVTLTQNRSGDVIDATLSFLENALNEAQKHYKRLRNKHISSAQYELMWQYGEQLAANNFEEWKKFYRSNVGERCDYEQLKRLFYKFYKLKVKQQKLANFRSSWYNI